MNRADQIKNAILRRQRKSDYKTAIENENKRALKFKLEKL